MPVGSAYPYIVFLFESCGMACNTKKVGMVVVKLTKYLDIETSKKLRL